MPAVAMVMMEKAYESDVFVVGGGPAGLAAAIAARQRGLRVLLADCARPPIDKACGEGLMPDSIAALRALGVTLDGVDTGRFRGIRFLGREHSTEATFPNGIGAGIHRTVLHDLLVDRAQQTGVELRWGMQVRFSRSGPLLDGRTVGAQWVIGADGQNSQVRAWAGLASGREYARRIGWRRHFQLEPWSDYVEIYWGEANQIYITPIGANEICVALISRRRPASFEAALAQFPAVVRRLGNARATSSVRGAVTMSRQLKAVSRPGVALIGEASGSADAITGDGLTMCFRQAVALGDALVAGDLSRYQAAHRVTMRLPQFMGRAMLLMDKSAWLRRRALRAFSVRPELFQRLLSIHVGETPLVGFGLDGIAHLGWQLLTP